MKPLGKDIYKDVFVDTVTDVKAASFCEPVEKKRYAYGKHEKISLELGITAPVCRINSQVKYAEVAQGHASIYLRIPRVRDYQEKIWDHAAGSILVKEAGGRVTDFGGKPLKFAPGRTLARNSGILATNGHLHQKVLNAIAKAL
jgi:3'(2'), 5'-bisphosphate nucleotidase